MRVQPPYVLAGPRVRQGPEGRAPCADAGVIPGNDSQEGGPWRPSSSSRSPERDN
jgi:hypothetical protein